MNVSSLTSGRIALSLAGALLMGPAWAQEPEATEPETAATAEESKEHSGPQLNYQTGEVVLPNKVASLHLGKKYRYLNPGETEKLLVAWYTLSLHDALPICIGRWSSWPAGRTG